MMFLYSVFCQWFSRGCLLKCCLEQQKWQVLVITFLIGFAVGSPVQGYMSDKGSRKKILLVTILFVILSMLAMVIGTPICPDSRFPILLSVASIINGVFGNVFPVASAAYSQRINDFQAALKASLICRYGALALPFVLQLAHFYGFLAALIINVISFCVIALKFDDKAVVKNDY